MEQNWLQAEIYFISAVMTALIPVWQGENAIASTLDLMLRRCALSFCLSFVCGAIRCAFGWAGYDAALYLYSLEFLLFAPGVYFWCGYTQTLLGSRAFDGKKRLLLTLLPLVPALALIAVNLFKPVMFAFDEKHRLWFKALGYVYFLYLFACALASMLGLIRQSLREAEPSQRNALRVTALLPLCLPLKLLLGERFEDELPLVCALIAFLLLGIYMGRTRRQVSLDPLTQVNNRHNLMGFMDYKLKNYAGEMCLMMIDIDDFKHINDTYGHLEGDRALTLTASALKRACGPFPRRPYIARYGGDEFIILMDGSGEDAERLKAEFNAQLSKDLIGGKEPLSLSVGTAPYTAGFSAKEWIAMADEKLYEIKPKSTARREG